MTASDVQIGARLRLYGQQVEGYYHEPEGEKRFFAVPGVYRVEARQDYANHVIVIHFRGEASGDLFECTLYHLAAILGPWSRVE